MNTFQSRRVRCKRSVLLRLPKDNGKVNLRNMEKFARC